MLRSFEPTTYPNSKTMHILQTSFLPNPSPSLSLSPNPLSLLPKLSSLSLTHNRPPPSTFIRNGGGPRTYPGGVSKWQWKRMQAKKSKQLLKARLSRERSIYEMRKRAELKAAVSNLERPWEVVANAQLSTPSSSASSGLFSVSADEQLKVLADRFQKPGGFDLWSDNDGPQIFKTVDDLPSARFFPKGVVHSLKPYVGDSDRRLKRVESSDYGFEDQRRIGGQNSNRKGYNQGSGEKGVDSNYSNRGRRKVKVGNSKYSSNGNSSGLNSSVENSSYKDGNWRIEGDGDGEFLRRDRNRGKNSRGRGRNGKGLMDVRNLGRIGGSKRNGGVKDSEKHRGEDVYDMSLQGDGSYGFSGSNTKNS